MFNKKLRKLNPLSNNRGQIGQILVVIVLIILSVLAIVKYIVPMFNKADDLSTVSKSQLDSITMSIKNQVAGADNVIINGGETRNIIAQFQDNQDVVVRVTTRNATGGSTTTISYLSNTTSSNARTSAYTTGTIVVGYGAADNPTTLGYINPSSRFLKRVYFRGNGTLEAVVMVEQ